MGLRDGEFGYHDLERSALGFVLEAETWPVFLAWARKQGQSPEIRAWLDEGPDLGEARKLWAEHSPDVLIRLQAMEMP